LLSSPYFAQNFASKFGQGLVPRPSLGATGMNGQIQQGHYRSSDDGLVIKQCYCMKAISVDAEYGLAMRD